MCSERTSFCRSRCGFLWVLKTESSYVVQTVLELAVVLLPHPCPPVEIAGVYLHTFLFFLFLPLLFSLM